MWLCYLDETGNTGSKLDDPQQPLHLLVGLLVPEEHIMALDAAMRLLISRQRGTPGSNLVELHGAQLFSGDGPWRGIPPVERIAVYHEALDLLAIADIAVAYASIDKRALAAKYSSPDPPHLLAFNFLAEKIDKYLLGQPDALRQRAILIADETKEHEDLAIDLVRTMQATGNPLGGRMLQRIIDTVHFVKSEQSPGVQLADLVAYAIGRVERVGASPSKAGDQALNNLFQTLIWPRVRTWREPWPT